MKDFDELLAQLESQNNDVPWTGPDGLMWRAAEAIRYLRYERNHTKYLNGIEVEKTE
jgi:hypothetical protein